HIKPHRPLRQRDAAQFQPHACPNHREVRERTDRGTPVNKTADDFGRRRLTEGGLFGYNFLLPAV
ncbi:MAG: hypothetical protein KJ727_06460, partial [Acidobacteria bacterium]|nr:hypothetical protein [Acidobacteriota bacterium]